MLDWKPFFSGMASSVTTLTFPVIRGLANGTKSPSIEYDVDNALHVWLHFLRDDLALMPLGLLQQPEGLFLSYPFQFYPSG